MNNTVIKNTLTICFLLITAKLTAAEAVITINGHNLDSITIDHKALLDIEGELIILDMQQNTLRKVTEHIWLTEFLPNPKLEPFYIPCLNHPRGRSFVNAKRQKYYEGKLIVDETALHVAVGYANHEAVKALLLAGADPNVKNNQNQYPYEYADTLFRGVEQLKKHAVFSKRPESEFKNIKDGLLICLGYFFTTF